MPGRSRPARTPPVVFDEAAWAEDMLRASAAARAVAEDARASFEESGVAIDQLKACAAEGSDGTELPHCVKVYLAPSDGPHGMVFEIDRVAGRLRLLYVAFGLRHPSRDMRQPSVYQSLSSKSSRGRASEADASCGRARSRCPAGSHAL